MRYRSIPFLLLTSCLTAAVFQPGDLIADDAPPFPRDPAQWINSAPITLEQVRGKAVFLWFFEEGCPRCREKWPMMLAKSASFQDKPIVFMAVNSGNPPAAVRDYARSVNASWPIIADVDRSLEKACEVPTISLNNIMQFYYISHDGTLHQGN